MKRSAALLAGLVSAAAVCAGCSQGRIGGPEDAGVDAADGAGVDDGGDSGPDAGADPGADAGGDPGADGGGDSGGDTTIEGWSPVGLSGGGGMFAPSISAADPDLMMINCDMSGSYVSEDGGHWWRLIHFKQRQSYLHCPAAFHPQDSNVILAPRWDRLKISNDRGRSWEDWSDLGASAYGQIVYDPDVAGKVWGAFSEVHDIPNANIIHNRHWGGDPESGGGATWARVARFGREHFSAYFHPQRPGWVYATMCEGTPEWALWLSTDGGDNWEAFESFPFANTQRVQFDPADPNVIYVTTFGASVLKGPARPGG